MVVVAIAAGAGCGRSLVRNTDQTATPDARITGAAEPTEAPKSTAASGSSQAGPGRLELGIFDDNGGQPAGIPVEIAGPSTRTLVSDANGGVTLTGPPGQYSARVVKGCHDRIEVDLGGTARFRLVGGRTTTGSLRAVWRHRYGPISPVSSSLTGGWPIGERVEVAYGIADRCTEKRAPSATFPTFVFETSRNLRVAETPVLRANDDGFATVVVSCTAPGEFSLVVSDKTNPSDEVDLAEYLVGYGGPEHCGN
jgi:hypothetical protein